MNTLEKITGENVYDTRFTMNGSQERTLIKRSDLVRRIRNLIVIVRDYEQKHLLQHMQQVTIPYYLVGLDDEMVQEVRSYFAEMIFVAALEYPGRDDTPMAGLRISRLARKSAKLEEWLKTAPYFAQAERDWISYWCNPVVIQPDYLASFGMSAYIGGHWQNNVVTARWIKEQINYDERTHMIVYDHN